MSIMSEHGFFGLCGDTLSAKDSTELGRVLAGVDIDVPLRTQGRTAAHRERYCIVKFLQGLLKSGAIRYPITVTKNRPDHKSPDFFIQLGDIRIGVEHTDAGPESYQRAEALAERDAETPALELSYYGNHSKIRSQKSLRKGFVRPERGLRTEEWTGNEVEIQWAKFIGHAIRAKRQKARSGNYDVCDEYELLVYDNTPTVVCVNRKEALEILNHRFRTTRPFRRVTILDDGLMLRDIFGHGVGTRTSAASS